MIMYFNNMQICVYDNILHILHCCWYYWSILYNAELQEPLLGGKCQGCNCMQGAASWSALSSFKSGRKPMENLWMFIDFLGSPYGKPKDFHGFCRKTLWKSYGFSRNMGKTTQKWPGHRSMGPMDGGTKGYPILYRNFVYPSYVEYNGKYKHSGDIPYVLIFCVEISNVCITAYP